MREHPKRYQTRDEQLTDTFAQRASAAKPSLMMVRHLRSHDAIHAARDERENVRRPQSCQATAGTEQDANRRRQDGMPEVCAMSIIRPHRVAANQVRDNALSSHSSSLPSPRARRANYQLEEADRCFRCPRPIQLL